MTGWGIAIVLGFCWWRVDVYRQRRAAERQADADREMQRRMGRLGRLGE